MPQEYRVFFILPQHQNINKQVLRGAIGAQRTSYCNGQKTKLNLLFTSSKDMALNDYLFLLN